MARIGLNNFRYSHLTESEDGTPIYDGAKKVSAAVECKTSIENNSAELYGDDVLQESDTSFKKGTFSITLTEDNNEFRADLLGHKTSEDGEMVRNANDTAPYIGAGRVVTKLVNNVKKYCVEIIYKIKFKESLPDEKTKGENMEFTTPTLEGDISILANGDWSKSKEFGSKKEAIKYLEDTFKAPETPKTPENISAKG